MKFFSSIAENASSTYNQSQKEYFTICFLLILNYTCSTRFNISKFLLLISNQVPDCKMETCWCARSSIFEYYSTQSNSLNQEIYSICYVNIISHTNLMTCSTISLGQRI
ncbi:hypothetical protein VCUG_02648 [Vavraia culicis subsp. floridensis]|uniref:Uncharacterized protein n=1 Tax=Vavraia culicis (isolate floridensis) TaxID=948595 RepID=L2GQI6_VAVCU|nr:uncharacterized protein VCUG_02648 [Vavraia culicis subsp. floridensis]ELA45864.1 hypothetical protein VCUG_02648 [Vavraia culicis subsp. floridensis]